MNALREELQAANDNVVTHFAKMIFLIEHRPHSVLREVALHNHAFVCRAETIRSGMIRKAIAKAEGVKV